MSELAVNGSLGAPSDAELIEDLARARARIAQEIGKRVVGQEGVIEQLLIALFSRGHCLFVGVPGLAKTLLISTLAEAPGRCSPTCSSRTRSTALLPRRRRRSCRRCRSTG